MRPPVPGADLAPDVLGDRRALAIDKPQRPRASGFVQPGVPNRASEVMHTSGPSREPLLLSCTREAVADEIVSCRAVRYATDSSKRLVLKNSEKHTYPLRATAIRVVGLSTLLLAGLPGLGIARAWAGDDGNGGEIELGDGWFTYEEPGGDFETEYTEGAVTWVYDGMVAFHRGVPHEATGFAHNSADIPVGYGDIDTMLANTERIDAEGRRWIAEPADRSTIIGVLEEFAEYLSAELGIEPDGDVASGLDEITLPDDEAAGVDQWYTPNSSWNFDDHSCTGEERHSYGTDDTFATSSPWTDDERKSVILYVDQDGDGDYDSSCAGTLVDRRWVLTAGHCLVDDPDAPSSAVLPRRVAACSFGNTTGNAECSTGSLIQLGPDYLASPSELTDFGLLKLTSELNAGIDLGYRAISSATEATIEASTVYIDGSPGLKATTGSHCASNVNSSPQVTSVTSGSDTYTISSTFYSREDTSTTVDFTTALITDSMDLGEGFSGAGYWYVSGGGGDYVVAVHSGFLTIIDWGDNSDGYFNGPKHDVFRSWVNSTI